MKYLEIKERMRKELNEFEGIFFAFTQPQLKKEMQRFGLDPKETSQILSLGAGTFVLKSKRKEFDEMFKRHQREMERIKENEDLLLEAISYELRNHEYCITHSETEALESLGLTKEDVPERVLNMAKSEAMACQ